MPNQSYKWKGAVELAAGTHTASPNTSYKWKGAVEPAVVAAGGGLKAGSLMMMGVGMSIYGVASCYLCL